MFKKIQTLFLLLCITLLAKADGVYFNSLEQQKNLPLNILSIYQDEIGAMWFGTLEGICRYNGNETQVFTPGQKTPGLTQNVIYKICGNQNGTIYFKANYDIVKYDVVKEQFTCIKEKDVRTFYYNNKLLWFATDSALYQYNEENDSIHFYSAIKNVDNIHNIHISEDNIWIGTDKNLILLSSANKNDQRVVLQDIDVSAIYVDSRKNVWVGTQKNGIYLLNRNGQLLSHYTHAAGKNSISNNQIRSITEDNANNIWIGTFFGLNCFNITTHVWSSYIHIDNIPNSISHSSVTSLYNDRQGTIWVGTYFGGVNYYNPEMDVFKFYSANSQNDDYLSFPFVGNMVEDDDNNLWICTEGGGLNRLNLKTHQISRYMYYGYDFESVMEYNQKCIWYRPEKQLLYIGMHNGGLAIFDIRTKKYTIYTTDINDPFSLPNNTINDLQYYNDDLILLTASGLAKMDIEANKFYPFITDKVMNRFLARNQKSKFLIDKNNQLWTPMHEGLLRINLGTKQIKEFKYNPEDINAIGKFRITDILETTQGELYFATSGSGLFRYNPEEENFTPYTEEGSDLLSNYCYSVKEMPSGNLLILFNNGMAFFNPDHQDKKLFYSTGNFPLTGFFQGCSSYTAKNGEIFIGGINGLVSVYESQLNQIPSDKYNIYFDKLLVNNTIVLPDDKTNILPKSLPFCNEVILKHKQNNIIVDFATSNYLTNNSRNFQYKLEGFDEQWTPATSPHIVYTNIPPGKYKLRIREVSTGGNIINSQVKELSFRFKPPFYASPLAYVVYIILLFGLFYAIIRFFIWREKLHSAIELERKEKEQNEELNKIKLRFFTNISHELRTPLTLIIGQIQDLLRNNEINGRLHNKVNRIYRNSLHMLNLISELLDFRKQEQGFLKLKVEELDLVAFVNEIYETFQELAVKNQIKYSFEQPGKKIHAYIDPVQFRKVIYNILSNAFKYTPSGGEINIRFKQEHNTISIYIEDTGIGIPAESLSKIFDRFYQIEYRTAGLSLGTGIGLALTKEIVNAHKGEITVNSTLNKGSVFEITLLTGKEHFDEDQLAESMSVESRFLIANDTIHETEEKQLSVISTENEEENAELNDAGTEAKYSILIIEDNEDLLDLLEEVFSKTYKVHTAKDGRTGFEMAVDLTPDIILSDVMLPEMSGKELCYKIKNNINLSHIPVVLLTAQTTITQTMEGYIFGADDYITKPFNIDMLILRCNNLIKNRQLLLRKITRETENNIPVNAINEHDKILIEKATAIIRENFDNPDFDMNVLASELALGRNKLYTRIKDILGVTPNEFTLSIKMNEAVHLLENSRHLNISEIAYTLGFSTIKYFSKTFKAFYGITPQAWRKSKNIPDESVEQTDLSE